MTVRSVERGIVLPITKIGEEQACNKQANKQTFCYEQLLIIKLDFLQTELLFSHTTSGQAKLPTLGHMTYSQAPVVCEKNIFTRPLKNYMQLT